MVVLTHCMWDLHISFHNYKLHVLVGITNAFQYRWCRSVIIFSSRHNRYSTYLWTTKLVVLYGGHVDYLT